jgi:hypothetical protein
MRPDAHFWPVQKGAAGDMTASRKVRVFDIPFEEAYARLKKKLPVPEHLANSLYLEWFSQNNGRVVVESSDCKVTISQPSWRLTPEDEQKRQSQAADGFDSFMRQLSEAVEAQRYEKPEDHEWDEFDYEKFMRESDARTDQYSELLDKYMDHPDRDNIIAKEMGWSWLEESLQENGTEESGSRTEDGECLDGDARSGIPGEIRGDDAPPLEPDPATEGVDWVRDDRGHLKHPLCLRALRGAMKLWQECEDLGLEEESEPDVSALIGEYQITSAKLAGALNSLGYGRSLREGAFIVAYLKRALGHLHAAQAALERAVKNGALPPKLARTTRAELFSLREEILNLMQEFRKK